MYSVYVARKRVGKDEYTAFLIEGEGIHSHLIKKSVAAENPRLAYVEAFVWATQLLRSIFTNGLMPIDDITYISNNIIFVNWMYYYFGETVKKPPQEYRETLNKVYENMEALECRYCVNHAEYNRALQYATAKAWEEQERKKVKEKAIDAFANWDEE